MKCWKCQNELTTGDAPNSAMCRHCENTHVDATSPPQYDRLHDPDILRRIIARNARQRLTADYPDAPMLVTLQDIKDGMAILAEVEGK
jgi:hypothetical protein